MDDLNEFVERETRVRIRQESACSYLLYHPGTDELYLLDANGKAIFDLCDGRSIDDVVSEASLLLESDPSRDAATAELEVLGLLRSLHERALVRFS